MTTDVVTSSFSEVLGRPVNFVTVPVEGYVASLGALEPWFAKGLGELATVIAQGHAKVKKKLLKNCFFPTLFLFLYVFVVCF